MQLFSRFILYVALLVVVMACGALPAETPSPADTLVTRNPSMDPKGDITGFVTLHDEFGVPKPDNAGMIVSLEGERTAFPASTRPEGRFVIGNVFAGKYNLSYNKNNYGNYKLINISHSGGLMSTIAEPVSIWETPKTKIADLGVSVKGLSLTFTGMATPIQPTGTSIDHQRRVRLFFGRDEKITFQRYVSSFNQSPVPPGGSGNFTVQLSADDLLEFKPGERVYVVAYGITAIENAYVDPDSKLKIYSGVNPEPSNVVSFLLP
ncbi:hypothetical protein HNV11_07285 [Spirosoma taeanense]|uniref:Carboxypeptidase regulatory-like domain-containing protein n=1 Tax=Spirosoma taeanense TaxID=2735870 RepID=A0A6M5Y5T1_9BACT|nr:hypothetical protein [Spirosoma taeanense]QJW89209.1 hypothetical protein HNV11_07285 [Spirosoma taeanense]